MRLSDEIEKGESKTLELKEILPNSDSIAKTIVAFSNTSGGKLVIGVNDKREITGINNVDIFELQDKISSIVYDKCYPIILPEIYTKNINGKVIFVVEVFRGNLLPYYIKTDGKNNGTYIRIGATNRKAGFDNIIELERQKRNISFDEEINYEFEFSKLDISPLKNKFEEIKKVLDEGKLKNLKLIKEEQGKIYPTNALLILLGQIENTETKCSRFKGNTMEIFLDKKEYRGDLFYQLEEIEKFIKNHINLRGEIKGLQRTDIYEIPLTAIREALLNAIIHRDYTNLGRDIKVGIYDDILNIVSPGGFPNTLTQEDILEGRSEVRNRVVARVFKELGYIEQWGSGINRIKFSCINYGLKEPLIQEKGDFVDVELYRESTLKNAGKSSGIVADSSGIVADSSGKIFEQELRIINYLQNKESITSKDIENLLHVKSARARRILQEMIKKNQIRRSGTGRNTYYVMIR
jgi:ATP-dependent DNA helicase RecG